jgi:hypothetical protein
VSGAHARGPGVTGAPAESATVDGMATKATGTYPAFVPASPAAAAPAPGASAPVANINSQSQTLPASSDQFQARAARPASRPLWDG